MNMKNVITILCFCTLAAKAQVTAPGAAPGVAPGAAPGVAPGVAPGAATGAAAEPCGDIPRVDVLMVPSRRWKTAGQELMRIKQQFKEFIKAEVHREARAGISARNELASPIAMPTAVRKEMDPYADLVALPPQSAASYLLTHPRFQQVSSHEFPHGEKQMSDASTAAIGSLQNLFDSNKVGTFLDMHQGASPGQYLEALTQALTQNSDASPNTDSSTSATQGERLQSIEPHPDTSTTEEAKESGKSKEHHENGPIRGPM